MVRNLEDARWIAAVLTQRGYAPTYPEMCTAWRIGNSSIHRRLNALRRMGLVAYVAFERQSLRAFVPDKGGRRRAYFELKPTLTICQVETTELRYICDEQHIGPSP